MQTILKMAGPILFWLLERWVQSNKKKTEFHESYYAFLDAVDKSGATKTANHLAAQNALKAEQDRLVDELNQKEKK